MEYIAVKFIDEDQGSIEGLGAPYHGPAAGKDLTGEYFDKETDFCPDWFKVRPLLYHHGLDPVIKTAPIGQITEWALKDEGLWVKGQLDKSNRYWEQIKSLIKAGKLYFSSGGLSHLVEKEANGHIKKWPWVEQSLTPTPANPFAAFAYKSLPDILQAGPNAEALKALSPDIMQLAAEAGIDPLIVPDAEIAAGFQDEQEHNDVTGGDPALIMKIVAAHLKEDPTYYSKIQAALGEGAKCEGNMAEVKASFDESKHPRADDGKFGAGSGNSGGGDKPKFREPASSTPTTPTERRGKPRTPPTPQEHITSVNKASDSLVELQRTMEKSKQYQPNVTDDLTNAYNILEDAARIDPNSKQHEDRLREAKVTLSAWAKDNQNIEDVAVWKKANEVRNWLDDALSGYSKSINIKESGSMNEAIKMEKPQGAPGFTPDPAIPAETQGLKPGEQKAPPAECPVKAMKCLHCGKAIALPQETLDALQALVASAQQAIAMGGGSATPANGPAEAPAIPGEGAAPSIPGVSQGMAPENHGNETPAKETPPVEAPAPGEGPGPEETPAHEEAEGPAHEAAEGPEQEKKEEQSAVKALLASVEAKVKSAVEEATKPLRERINTLESEPANGGPLRRAVKTTDNFKMGNEAPSTDRATAIKTIIATTDNESLKQTLGFELAMLQMNEVVQKGPQAPNG